MDYSKLIVGDEIMILCFNYNLPRSVPEIPTYKNRHGGHTMRIINLKIIRIDSTQILRVNGEVDFSFKMELTSQQDGNEYHWNFDISTAPKFTNGFKRMVGVPYDEYIHQCKARLHQLIVNDSTEDQVKEHDYLVEVMRALSCLPPTPTNMYVNGI